MTSRDFCYWLQGFFELRDAGHASPEGTVMVRGLDEAQTQMIRRHLALVFKHEIDPSIDGGNIGKKKILDTIHGGPTQPPIAIFPHQWNPPTAKPLTNPDGEILYRC